MSKSFYPAANRTIQYWGGVFFGSTMNTNCVCLHTTEGFTWPSYSGGAVAPHLTVLPNIAAKTVSVRQHYPADKSSRALANLAGGVETNTLNVLQIELIGTCDYSKRSTWLGKTAGVDYIYWPDAPDWLLEAIAPIFTWMDAEWPNFKIADATPRGWVKYPDSYGINARQRMSFSEWENAYGIFGHQHVPENAHGDPGNFPIARLIAFAKPDDSTGGGTAPIPDPAPPPDPTPAPVWGRPETWKLGAVGPDAVRLGERINAWNAVLGLPTWTPDDNFSSTERDALQKLQVAWGFGSSASDLALGGASDGYPGALTFTKLDEVPEPITPKVTLTGLHWNIAGSDTHNGYAAENGTRGPAVARWANRIGFEVFVTCEAGQDNLRAGMNTVLGACFPWEQRAKGIWHKTSIKKIAARKAYPADSIFSYLSTRKWGAAIFGEKDGKKFAVLEIHTDYRAPAKQAKQVQSITKKFWTDTAALGVPRQNTVICGDLNWDGTSGDNPFHALDGWDFEEKGNRTQATFLTGKHLDGVLAHKEANVTVTRPNRANSAGVKLSDHFPLKFVIELK